MRVGMAVPAAAVPRRAGDTPIVRVRHMDHYPVRPVRVRADIPASADAVFSFVADTRNDPLWCSNVDAVDLGEDEEISVGTRLRFHQHLEVPRSGRIEFAVDVTVAAMEGRSITWHTVDRFQTRTITLTVEPVGEQQSRIEQVTEAAFVRPPGVQKWLYPVLARRTLRRQFEALARHFAAPR